MCAPPFEDIHNILLLMPKTGTGLQHTRIPFHCRRVSKEYQVFKDGWRECFPFRVSFRPRKSLKMNQKLVVTLLSSCHSNSPS